MLKSVHSLELIINHTIYPMEGSPTYVAPAHLRLKRRGRAILYSKHTETLEHLFGDDFSCEGALVSIKNQPEHNTLVLIYHSAITIQLIYARGSYLVLLGDTESSVMRHSSYSLLIQKMENLKNSFEKYFGLKYRVFHVSKPRELKTSSVKRSIKPLVKDYGSSFVTDGVNFYYKSKLETAKILGELKDLDFTSVPIPNLDKKQPKTRGIGLEKMGITKKELNEDRKRDSKELLVETEKFKAIEKQKSFRFKIWDESGDYGISPGGRPSITNYHPSGRQNKKKAEEAFTGGLVPIQKPTQSRFFPENRLKADKVPQRKFEEVFPSNLETNLGLEGRKRIKFKEKIIQGRYPTETVPRNTGHYTKIARDDPPNPNQGPMYFNNPYRGHPTRYDYWDKRANQSTFPRIPSEYVDMEYSNIPMHQQPKKVAEQFHDTSLRRNPPFQEYSQGYPRPYNEESPVYQSHLRPRYHGVPPNFQHNYYERYNSFSKNNHWDFQGKTVQDQQLGQQQSFFNNELNNDHFPQSSVQGSGYPVTSSYQTQEKYSPYCDNYNINTRSAYSSSCSQFSSPGSTPADFQPLRQGSLQDFKKAQTSKTQVYPPLKAPPFQSSFNFKSTSHFPLSHPPQNMQNKYLGSQRSFPNLVTHNEKRFTNTREKDQKLHQEEDKAKNRKKDMFEMDEEFDRQSGMPDIF